MNIQEVRQKFPQYEDLGDDALTQALHKKFYADMPYDEFASKVGAKQRLGGKKTASAEEPKADLWEGVEGAWWKKPAAQLGGGFMDLAQGVSQLLPGGATREDVDEKRRIDARLNDDTTGKVLNFAGNVLPTMALPMGTAARGTSAALKALGVVGGDTAKRMAGSAAMDMILTGGALGATAPVGTEDSRAFNTGLGVAGSAVVPMVGGAVRGAKAAVHPFTKAGQQEAAAKMLGQFVDDPARAAAALAKPPMLVPGSPTTTPEVLGNQQLAALTNAISSKDVGLQTALANKSAAQNAARWNYLTPEIGSSDTVKALTKARGDAVEAIYEKAYQARLKPESISSIKGLIGRPDFDDAVKQAHKDLRNLYGKNVPEKAVTESVRGLHQVKVVLDRTLNGLKDKTLSADKYDRAALVGIKNQVMTELKKVKAYEKASERFAELSKPINRQELLQEITGKQYANATDVLGNPVLSAPGLRRAINNNTDEVRGVLNIGQQGMLDDVLRDIDRSNIFSKAGRVPTGSNTNQNYKTAGDLAGVAKGLLGLTGPMGSMASSVLSGRTQKAIDAVNDAIAAGLLDPAVGRQMLESLVQKAPVPRPLLSVDTKALISEAAKTGAMRLPMAGLLYSD